MFPIKYQNGNVHVTLESNGTKTREWPDGEEAKVDLPESCDLKITQYCDMDNVCTFCHEMSNKQGKHADLQKVKGAWENALPGMEIAIGGGNPLAHPHISSFLKWCKAMLFVPNLTVNSLHVAKFAEFLAEAQKNQEIHGLGISYRGKESFRLDDRLDYSNVVFHLILGIHTYDDCMFIEHECRKAGITPKILLLGYKTFGRGETYYCEEVQNGLDVWVSDIEDLLADFNGVLCFDNLAIAQLDLQSCLPKATWDKFWAGAEGSHTFYCDAVKEQCAQSSTSTERFPLGPVKEMFEKVRS